MDMTVRDWTVRAWDCQDTYGDSMKTGATAREATATEATAATATEATAAVLALVLALGLGPKRASIETRMMMSLVSYIT